MMGAIQAWIEATMTAAEKMRRACCCRLQAWVVDTGYETTTASLGK